MELKQYSNDKNTFLACLHKYFGVKGVGAGAFFGTKTCLTGKTITLCRLVGFH